MPSVRSWGRTTVLVVQPGGDSIDGRAARDLMAEAFDEGATMVAIPAGRLEPAFFDLRSGVAGDILQVSATYRMRLAIVGDLPEPAASSAAFAALVRESNAGIQHWLWRRWMCWASGSGATQARTSSPRFHRLS